VVEPFLRKEMSRRNIYPKVVPLETKGRPKEDRIEGLIPRYANGDIFHIEELCNQLEDQLLRFPKGKNDDIIDSLAYQIDFCKAPDEKKQQKELAKSEVQDLRFPDIGI
jgi:phage terminase large subunit-like protein